MKKRLIKLFLFIISIILAILFHEFIINFILIVFGVIMIPFTFGFSIIIVGEVDFFIQASRIGSILVVFSLINILLRKIIIPKDKDMTSDLICFAIIQIGLVLCIKGFPNTEFCKDILEQNYSISSESVSRSFCNNIK